MQLSGEKKIEATAEQVWELLAHRFDRLSDWASAIRASHANPHAASATAAPVAGRICEPRLPLLDKVTETIVAYDENRRTLTYEAEGLPAFLTAARNRWEVTAIGARTTRVSYEATVETRGVIGRLLALPLRLRLGSVADQTLDDLKRYVEETPASTRGPGKALEFSRTVRAPLNAAWDVVSDVTGFAHAAPNLSRAEILEGQGQGMQRRCYDARGRGWDEVCTLWEEGRRYGMRVRTETYPFPLRQMFRSFQGAWEVEPTGAGTLVSMRYELELSRLGRLMWLPIRSQLERQCEALLDNWEREIESRAAARTGQFRGDPSADSARIGGS